jgi:hypothetical protein
VVIGLALDNYGDYKTFNGMSPDVKIAFFDIFNNRTDDLQTPSNINSGLFTILYNAGARIMTNSWGEPGVNYCSSRCQQSDQFMWENQDTLVMFSAGNNGQQGSNTVSSPGVSKNVATVGASLNAKDSFLAYSPYTTTSLPDYYDIDSVAYFSSIGPTADRRLKPDFLAPGWWITSAAGMQTTNVQTILLGVY